MKINKTLVENKIITEAEEEVVTTVEPISTSDSVDVIADDVKDQVVAATDGEEIISDENAAKVAAEIKQTADEVDAGAAIISNGEDEPLGVKNAITDTLDAALNASLRNKRRGIKSGNNVLIVGLPGSGKTATVYDWAKARGNVNLVYINAKNNDLEAYINGYTVRDAENPNKVRQAYSDNLAALEAPNSVLFLDEYNRQIKPNIRASLYTLINEHKISGEGDNKTHEFKNLLFTIACINPAVPTDKGAAALNDAELSRFKDILDKYDSDSATTIDYLTKQYDKLIKRLDKNNEYYREDLEDYLRIQDLGVFIASHQNFTYDTRDDLEDLAALQKKMFNQRSFTEGLTGCNGDVDALKNWIRNSAGFLEKTTDMLLDILDDYIAPTFEQLCEAKGINVESGEIEKGSDDEYVDSDTGEVTSSEEEGIEDDEDDFFSNGAAGTVRAKNPHEVAQATENILKNW